MKHIEVNLQNSGLSAKAITDLLPEMEAANQLLHNGKGAGNDFLGWVDLPSSITPDELKQIETIADSLARKARVVVVIGIGGSYLGTKAVLDALSSSFDLLQRQRSRPIVLFAGQNLSEDYAYELTETLHGRDFALVVISKSGTTTEPAIAFRLLKRQLEGRYGKAGAAARIVAVTDASKGALRKLADSEGYPTFVIPDNVGGRYSVLTPVGLLPLAVAGIDIRALVEGAAAMQQRTAPERPIAENPAAQYAAARTALYRAGKKIEILASYEPKLQNIGEWWKQLYGESEGKEGKGIFPASVTLTADLHSMGQYIQEGERTLFETVISVEEPAYYLEIKAEAGDPDGLNFLAGRRLDQVNRMARLGTMLAHVDGGVPNLMIELPRIDAYQLGGLLYLFEKACGMSGYALGVNPFDQPGVEAYKRNMFALLGKPGFEAEGEALHKRLK